MNRREFCRHMALLAAGAAALPAQIEAFERLYDVNTRGLRGGIIDVQDIAFGFRSYPRDVTVVVGFWHKNNHVLDFPMNYRASFRYVTSPSCPLLVTLEGFRWTLTSDSQSNDLSDPCADFAGTLRFTDMDGVIHNTLINAKKLRLQEYF